MIVAVVIAWVLVGRFGFGAIRADFGVLVVFGGWCLRFDLVWCVCVEFRLVSVVGLCCRFCVLGWGLVAL